MVRLIPRRALLSALLVFAAPLFVRAARADEGMWTLDNPPTKLLKEQFQFEPNAAWLEHIRLSSVRFNDGGSGSFVSPTGLVLTNNHVALGQLQKVSTKEKNFVRDGFLAAKQSDEMKCPDLELNVLVAMENVTETIQGAVKSGLSEKDALKARKSAMAKVEKDSLERTKMRSDVVSLYHGGEYWLYRYKKYTDIRLVFAPEEQMGFFGGDPDNFTFPRHDLDMAIFRVYEDGKPIQSPAYLKWNREGAKDGELVFVSGHPGHTDRLLTLAQLETLRDYGLPLRIVLLERMLKVAQQYAAQGPEQARQAGDVLRGASNSLKALGGQLKGLKRPDLLQKKNQDEADFRKRIADNPEWTKGYGDAWPKLAELQKVVISHLKPFTFRRVGGRKLTGIALQIVRMVVETRKPDGERLEEYHDSQLDSLKFRLFSPAPIYPAFEEALLADSLTVAQEQLGKDDPFITSALDGRSPQEVAHTLISGTHLADPKVRKQLVEGGEAAVTASDDPLIVWVRKLDPQMREIRKWYEDNIEAVEVSCGEKVGKARFAAYGKSAYPDATFTLRLAYGTVKGYPMNGTMAPSKTTFYGLFDRAIAFDFKGPWNLPPRYTDKKDRLNLATPLNFVSTCDIIGGNSGSPVINRAGELVGLIFDGNIESLVGNLVYEEDGGNRAVAVHTGGMFEALKTLYDAGALATELSEH